MVDVLSGAQYSEIMAIQARNDNGVGKQNMIEALYTAQHEAIQRENSFYRGKAQLKQNKISEYCLLYTSPSPRDATLSRMPSSA